MHRRIVSTRVWSYIFATILLMTSQTWLLAADQRFLYVASPGIRNYLQYGGHGVLVFDIDQGHRFVKRISLDGYGLNDQGDVLNVKGICAHAVSRRLFVSTLQQLICLDLDTDQVLWQRSYELGCDRMSMSANGKIVYLPSYEQHLWYVVDATSGDELARVEPHSGAHNTVYGRSDRFVYLAGLRSPILTVADTHSHQAVRQIGPFGDSIRPFTVNMDETLAFVNVNELLGFEVGDLQTGKVLHRVEVQGYQPGPVKRHGCPSHGIGLTPDERELWVTDGANMRLHIFDATKMPPEQVASIRLRDEPGWVTFTIAGDLAYPSTGEVIDVATREVVATLSDEEGRNVYSEKMLEIDFRDGLPFKHGDQFGIGRRGPR